jgi:hypothetical protein
MLIAHARVSTDDRNLNLQRAAMTEAGCTRIYESNFPARTAIGRNWCACSTNCVAVMWSSSTASTGWRVRPATG